jgi:hypothetical protein
VNIRELNNNEKEIIFQIEDGDYTEIALAKKTQNLSKKIKKQIYRTKTI